MLELACVQYAIKRPRVKGGFGVECCTELEASVSVTGPRDRFIGRTLVSERVRAVIATAREERARAREQYRHHVTASHSNDDNSNNSVSSL